MSYRLVYQLPFSELLGLQAHTAYLLPSFRTQLPNFIYLFIGIKECNRSLFVINMA